MATPVAPNEKQTVTLFMPTLNEASGLRAVVPRLKREWFDQVLVADGNSTDDTVEFSKSQGFEVVIQSKPGIRHAYNEGFAHVRGDIVVTFSPDGNCIPEAIPELIAKIREGYDMVIASRYAGDAKSDDDDMITGFGNRLFTTTINRLHGGRYTDAMGIFRAYRTRAFYELDLDKDESYRMESWVHRVMGIEPLLSVRAAKRKLRVCDIPADEPKRLAGVRKLQVVRWGLAYMMQVCLERVYWT
jgi:glycosyltransferase involved in cell wall biosynthesis